MQSSPKPPRMGTGMRRLVSSAARDKPSAEAGYCNVEIQSVAHAVTCPSAIEGTYIDNGIATLNVLGLSSIEGCWSGSRKQREREDEERKKRTHHRDVCSGRAETRGYALQLQPLFKHALGFSVKCREF